MTSQVQVVVELTDVDNAVVLLSLADRPTVFDAPNDRQSRPVLLSFPTISMAMPSDPGEGLAPGFVGGIAEATLNTNPRIWNPRDLAPAETRRSDDLLDLRVESSTCTIYFSDDEDPVQDLSDPSWTTMTAKVERIRPAGVDELELELAPLTDHLEDTKIPIDEYRQYGDACPAFGITDELSFTSGSALEPSLTGPWCYTLAGVNLQSGNLTATSQGWLQWGDGATDGFVLLANIGGNDNLRLTVFGLTTATITTANNVLAEDGEPRSVSIRRDAEGIAILVNGEVVASADSTGTMDDPAPAALAIGTNSSTISAIGEFHTWGIAPTDDQLSTLLKRLSLPLPAGIVEVNRDGFSDIWPGVNGTDTDVFGDTATFGYGFEGEPDQHLGNHPKAFGTVRFVKPEYVRPADFVVELHFGDDLTAHPIPAKVEIRQRGVDVVAGFTLNSPGAGLITFTTSPEPLSEIRVSFTGTAAALSGEELIKQLAFFPDSPLTAAGGQRSPFVTGSPLDRIVSLYLHNATDGHYMAAVLPEVLRGLDAVLMPSVDGEYFVHRVPFEAFAVPVGATNAEADVILLQDVDFSFKDIDVDGDIEPINATRTRHSVTWDKSEEIDIDLDPPPPAGSGDPDEYAIRTLMVREHQEAEHRLGDDFEAANPGHVRGGVVPGLYVEPVDAAQESRRHLFGAASQQGARVIKIDNLRRRHPLLYQLGNRVVVHSSQIQASLGIPCRVIGFEAPQGGVELVEMMLARLQPDEIVATNDITATVADLESHPFEESSNFADSTGSIIELTVGWPAPPVINTAKECRVRVRLRAITDAITLQTIELPVTTPVLRVISGDSNVTSIENGIVAIATGGDVVIQATFDPTAEGALENLTAKLTMTRTGAGVARVFSVDYEYSQR